MARFFFHSSATIFIILLPTGLFSQTHFTFVSNTGRNATVGIPASANPNIGGIPLASGDEIGVFTPSGLCVGAVVWTGSSNALTVWGDNEQTPDTDGIHSGEQMFYRVWQRSINTEYPDVNFTYSQGDSIYIDNGIFVLSSLTAIPHEITNQFSVETDWNLISVPLRVSDPSKSFLFPTATSSVFAYQGSYVQRETLSNGVGYWLKFASAESLSIIGLPIFSETISVNQGWNIVGSISVAVAVTSISSIPPGIVTTQFFGYNQGYIVNPTIYPGKGYWVKVNQQGSIILSSDSSLSKENRIRIIQTSELPPAPPLETFGTTYLPKQYVLEQSYPNPFNPVTVIRYQLPVSSKVILRIYNILGQEVKTLVDEIQDAGYKSVEWNASQFASGVYYYRLQAKDFVETKKLLLIK
ncbi:MAG: T9SS type A sorting domain-containing protein [Ignavibacteriae bacterium]|nr:T9SS type A sorting domain-containing protein [Ignavibacteriota bacterium]